MDTTDRGIYELMQATAETQKAISKLCKAAGCIIADRITDRVLTDEEAYQSNKLLGDITKLAKEQDEYSKGLIEKAKLFKTHANEIPDIYKLFVAELIEQKKLGTYIIFDLDIDENRTFYSFGGCPVMESGINNRKDTIVLCSTLWALKDDREVDLRTISNRIAHRKPTDSVKPIHIYLEKDCIHIETAIYKDKNISKEAVKHYLVDFLSECDKAYNLIEK